MVRRPRSEHFASMPGHPGRPNGEDLIATVETRKGISILVRDPSVRARHMSAGTQMRVENS